MKPRLLVISLVFLVTLAVAHAVYALAATTYVQSANTSRGVNVRTLTVEDEAVTSRLIRRQPDRPSAYDFLSLVAEDSLRQTDGADVLIIGSSVTYGYPMSPEASLPNALGEVLGDGGDVASIAVLGFSVPGLTESACVAAARGMKVDLLIVEIPVTNEILSLSTVDPDAVNRVRDCRDTTKRDIGSLSEYFLRTPLGIRLPGRVDVESDTVLDENTVNPYAVPPSAYGSDPDIVEDRVRLANERLDEFLAVARQVSDNIVFFEAPVYAPALKDSILGGLVEDYLALVEAKCRSEAIPCLKASDRLETNPNLFYNITHLNKSGARRFAAELLQQVQIGTIDIQVGDRDLMDAYATIGDDSVVVSLGGIFPTIARRFFEAIDADGNPTGQILYMRGAADAISWIQSDGTTRERWNYIPTSETTADYNYTRHYADGRMRDLATGTIELTETGWTERDSESPQGVIDAEVRLEEDGSLSRVMDGETTRYLPVDSAALPPLTQD